MKRSIPNKNTFKYHDKKAEIRQYLRDHPDITIPRLARIFEGSQYHIRYALKKFGIQLKPPAHTRKEEFTAYVLAHPEMSHSDIAKVFKVSERTIYRHVKKNGIKPSRSYEKFNYKKLIRTIASHPDVTISDLAKMFKKSYAGMYVMLKHNNITIKNKLCYKDRKKPGPRKKK